MIEKLFEASIPAETLRSRAREIKKKYGEITSPTITQQEHSEIQEKPEIRRNENGNKFVEGTAPGPGRKPKYEPLPERWRGQFVEPIG